MQLFTFRSQNKPRKPLAATPVAAEIVEVRSMLAGNVTATLVDGLLTLSGDRRANDLIVQIDAAGTVAFSSSRTSVNGQPAAEVTLSGVVESISGSFGRGRDRVVIEGIVASTGSDAFVLPTLPGGLEVHMGRGRDRLTVRGFEIDGELSANGGRHRDRVVVESVNVGTSGVRITGDRGRDTLAVRDVDVEGNVTVSGGRGRDRLVIGDDVTVAGTATVSGNQGRTRTIVAPQDGVEQTPEVLAQQARIDRFFESTTNGTVSTETQEAWSRSNDVLFTNTIDAAVFPTTFPAIDPAEFTETASGLRYRIVDAGSETMPTASSDVTVSYQGLLSDGTQFDGTDIIADAGFDPSSTADFGLPGLIEGWQEGLPLIGEGGRIQLLIPPALAYGSAGTSGVPADATIFFNIELASIN